MSDPHSSALSALRLIALAVACASVATAAHAASAAAGKTKFENECSGCHMAQAGDGGGDMGPKLGGLAGKAAGTVDKSHTASAALKNSKLVWNAATLDRFLAAPTRVVPGSAMDIAVTNKANRDDIVAYLLSLKAPPPARR